MELLQDMESVKSARMVGSTLNKCPSDVLPDRVVSKQGLVTGKMHFDGITLIQDLLEIEGVQI